MVLSYLKVNNLSFLLVFFIRHASLFFCKDTIFIADIKQMRL